MKSEDILVIGAALQTGRLASLRREGLKHVGAGGGSVSAHTGNAESAHCRYSRVRSADGKDPSFGVSGNSPTLVINS